MELNLTGQQALVTGGSAGIGLAVAEGLAREGCHVVLASRDAAKLEAAATRIRLSCNVAVTTEAIDIADDASHARLAEKYPDVDILVNNAGAIPSGSIEQIGQSRFRDSWDLKVFGFIGMTREFYRRMAARRSGVIVNIIGASGTRGDPAYMAGSVGNAAVTQLTLTLGSEGPVNGVRVVGVSPGAVSTSRQEGVLRNQAELQLGDPERWMDFVQAFPFGRMARPEEVADVVAFLASPRASYVSGVVVNVDGGMSQRHKWWPAGKT